MYKLSIFNNNVETVIHFPSNKQDDPHLNKLDLKEGLSVVDTLSLSLYPNNSGYDKVFELTTKIKVIDLRDNSIRFTGRVLDVSNQMDNSGTVYKTITCEGALSYLNDTKLRGSSFYAPDVTNFLYQILTIHNSKVEPWKQIYVGTVNIVSNVIHTCEFKTTFAEIAEVREIIGGQIRVREVNNVLYLDWLQSFNDNVLEVSLGVNMKDMVISKDVTSLGTRIIPLGANNLTIETVNGGVDYLEDAGARAIYGVIEKTVEYKDIEDATVLRNTCINDISNHTQPLYILKSNALDLSFLTGNKAEQFTLGVKLHLLNRFMLVDATYSVVEINLNLLEPYNPTLTISQKPVTLSSAINDLRKSSIQNDGVYNNVQIGRSFGIRAVRSDNKVITTINATEGISIENQTKKVFFVDVNGNLVCNDLTANDITANGGTYNDINVNQGTFTDITAEGGTFNNIMASGGFVVKDGEIASCTLNASGIHLVDTKGKLADIGIIDDPEISGVYMPDDLYIKDWLRVGNSVTIVKNLSVEGTIRVGAERYQLIDVIEDAIKALVKPESLK